MAIDHTRQRDPIPRGDISLQASNLDALMIEVSVGAGRNTIVVCGEDDADANLVAVRPLAAGADSRSPRPWLGGTGRRGHLRLAARAVAGLQRACW